MKQYLPLALSLVVLATAPSFATEDKAPEKSMTPAAVSQAEPTTMTPADTATDKAAQEEQKDAAESQATGDDEAKAAPALENSTDSGKIPASNANSPATSTVPAEAPNAEAKAAEAPNSAPNVQKLFNIFHTNKQQAEADTEKKEAPEAVPGQPQAPQH